MIVQTPLAAGGIKVIVGCIITQPQTGCQQHMYSTITRKNSKAAPFTHHHLKGIELAGQPRKQLNIGRIANSVHCHSLLSSHYHR